MRRLLLPLTACVWLAVTPAFGQFVRISVSTAGVEADGASRHPSISADGRYVVFQSTATNLVAGDTNNTSDIFLRDRDTDDDDIFDEPGAVSTTRISLGPGGAQSAGVSQQAKISDDGRYVVFMSNAIDLVPGGITTDRSQIYRRDLTTGENTMVTRDWMGRPASTLVVDYDMSPDARHIVFRTIGGAGLLETDAGSTLGAIYSRDMSPAGGLRRHSEELPPDTPGVSYRFSPPAISTDGGTIAFAVVRGETLSQDSAAVEGAITLVDVESGAVSPNAASGHVVALGGNGRQPFGLASGTVTWPQAYAWSMFHQTMATGDRVPTRGRGTTILDVSRDSRYAIVASTVSFAPLSASLYDSRYRMPFSLPFTPLEAHFDGVAGELAFSSTATGLAGAGVDTNGASDIYVVNLRVYFDQDLDLLDDRAESFYGLSTASAAGPDGAAGDPDNDGLANAAEIAAGTHPRGLVTRYLAEGATSEFFRTHVALANPDLDPLHGAGVVLAFARDDGTIVRAAARVEAGSRVTVDAGSLAGLEGASFSVVVESDRPVVVDRTMAWDTRSPLVSPGYGAHTEAAVESPGTEWYLAEGATGVFELFYLLQNPQDAPVEVTVRYLTPDAAPLSRPYTLAPHSRTTIRVNAVDPALAISDVSAAFTASAPIIVERAMYANRPGQTFALGHAARGVTAPATSWFLAEGATGEFFDTYVLIANPTPSEASITARFDADAASVERLYTVAPNSRFTIVLDSVPGLGASAVSTTITSTTPVIVERAMYWPGGFLDYYEGHASVGSTTTGLRWALAEGVDGGAEEAQTFVLIANTSGADGRARITPLFETGPGAPVEIALPAHGRTTVRPGEGTGRRFGTLIESIGAAPAPLVVEGAFYWNVDGLTWAAGSGVVATRLP